MTTLKKYETALRILLIYSAFCSALLSAAEIYVDYANGKNSYQGNVDAPLANFSEAIARALPGDTIRILPSPEPILDFFRIHNKKGTSTKPITIDGMFNTFLGTERLDPTQWHEIRPGLWQRRKQVGENMICRYFMVFDGRINRMGRCLKAEKSAKFKEINQLQPGEWTIREVEPEKEKDSVRWFDFYVKLPIHAGTLAEANISEPSDKMISGVEVSGACEYLHFRNLIVKNFWNDGFNIHDHAYHIDFDTVAALDCGDDGASAHENAIVSFRNYISIGNSTGFCHVGTAKTVHENVWISETVGREIFLLDRTENVIRNVFIYAESDSGSHIINKGGENHHRQSANRRWQRKVQLFTSIFHEEKNRTADDHQYAIH